MSGPHHWSETAANNGSSDPNADLRPGRPANTVLGAIRGLMETVALARDDDLAGLVATLGANNAFAVSTNEGLIDIATGVNGIPAAITKPFTIAVTFSAAPTAVATTPPHLVVDGFDCGSILHADGSALADGDVATGRVYHVLGDMAVSTDTKVTRVRCLDISSSEISALARAAAAPLIAALGSPVQKAGDTMVGDLYLSAPPGASRSPQIDLLLNNVAGYKFRTLSTGRLQVCDHGETVEIFSVGAGGDISTRQFGDLNARIEKRASDYANAAADFTYKSVVTAARWVYAGDKTCVSQPNTGGFVNPFGSQAMSCDFWSWSFTTADGQSGAAPYALRYRNLQVFIAQQGWVTVGAVS